MHFGNGDKPNSFSSPILTITPCVSELLSASEFLALNRLLIQHFICAKRIVFGYCSKWSHCKYKYE